MTKPKINAPDWLTARPIAHRGLHSRRGGTAENTLAAASAAMARNYAIECDVRRSKDGKAIVFHDETLDRLTQAAGPVGAFSAAALERIRYKNSTQTVAALSSFLGHIKGRVPVVIEIKSSYDGDMRLADRVLSLLANYPGPACVKSFDPEVIVHLRRSGASLPLGLVMQAGYDADDEWGALSPGKRESLSDLRDFPEMRPDFLSWNHRDFPHAVPMLCRKGIGMPVMTWAVGSEDAAQRARLWADQIIFEDFEP